MDKLKNNKKRKKKQKKKIDIEIFRWKYREYEIFSTKWNKQKRDSFETN